MLRGLSAIVAGSLFFAALPSTTNYKLNGFGFGSGGGATSTSNYSLQGITGEVSGNPPSTANYSVKPAFIQTEQANVPGITLTNPSSYYDKLKFVIDTQNNPTDALYEMQVCVGANFTPTSCATNGGTLRYLKNDDTLGASIAVADYQTYAAWGGASGQNIIGLSSNTTYYIQARATQGKYTESAYGPSSNAATVGQQLSFCLYSNANCGLGGSSEAFGALTVGIVTNSPTNIGIDFATNADSGGKVYVYSANGGLKSNANGFTLASATANLAVATSGFGAQITSVTQSSGGPLLKVSPFNGSSNNVGALTTTTSYLLSTLNPIVGGTASVQLQVKPSNTTPAASDYAETLTFIAAAAF